MFLTITPAAQVKLQPYVDQKLTLLLNFNDGVGEFAHDETSCSLDVDFQLLIVQQLAADSAFNQKLATSMGDFWIKDYSATYLDDQLTLDLTANGSLSLSGAHAGLIDGHVDLLKI
ncbi:iron-sulfur cluster biosynthesis family protein [Bombilactobacillus folatiphilus]|uniref:Iron-sulfur cluster biosynthesis family protein n=1 Tax=Bombilactobacillus folatiphilus TaxID=2923362 RepID=A0ABY4P8H6_9LACO|nr:iron-sulfur cluster biosynthesis family protein [Bombilactobacillus folatiphilus]UQS81895.1 iron-sulfur cluster biosynthesis family protein [Bombilactobacillus folatiphilus]